MVPPFDHRWIIAGQGTLGLEILDQCHDVGTVLAPIGGGGLVSGVAAAIKQSKPHVTVIGIEPSGAASMKNAVDAGEVRTLEGAHSIADGLMAVRPGDLNFAHVRRFVDRIDMVDDAEIAAAVRWLFVNAKIVAEPSGAATVAAALRVAATYAPPVVAIVSGGNLDPADLAKYTD
jgi:threonine dehydratase